MALKGITVRQLQDEDMVEVSEWFAKRNWNSPPQGQMLPSTGYVAVKEGKLLSVAWLYITNSAMGIVDWIATSPDAGFRGIASLENLINYIEDISKETTTSYFHFTPNDKLAKYLKRKCRFKIAETGVNLCIRNAR